MNTDQPNAAFAANAIFGLRREAQRHAAFGGWRTCEKRCRRYALPPHSKSLSNMRAISSLYYGLESRDFTNGCKTGRLKFIGLPFYPCPSVPHCGIRGFFIFLDS